MKVSYSISDKNNFQILYNAIKTIRKDGEDMECLFHSNGIVFQAGKSSRNSEKAKLSFYFESGFFQGISNNQTQTIAVNLANIKQLLLRFQGIKKTVSYLSHSGLIL